MKPIENLPRILSCHGRWLSVTAVALLSWLPLLIPAASGQHALRQGRLLKTELTSATESAMRPHTDSTVTVAGFEKALRSKRETMFVTNHSRDTITALWLTADYTDTLGRQLHRQSRPINVDLPPGQTRRIEQPSFDRDGMFYYYQTPPARSTTAATPFKVTVHIDSLKTR